MRVLLLLALLGMTAACVPPPAPPSSVAAAAAVPPPQPVALVPPWVPPELAPPAPAPAPVAAPAVVAPLAAPVPPPAPGQPVVVAAFPNPLAWLFTSPPPGPWHGRVTLSNFSYDNARVQAVVTPYADCEVHPGTASSDFELPLNGTRIIAAQPGTDICWRRELTPGPTPNGTQLVSGWTGWSRVFTATGSAIDSQL